MQALDVRHRTATQWADLGLAHAMLAHGFNHLGLSEIIAVTSKSNRASARVMEKVGMIDQGFSKEYYAQELVLYQITQVQWRQRINAQ